MENEKVRAPLKDVDVPTYFSTLQTVTTGGIIFSLAIVIGVMLLYSRDIALRLSVMMENVKRLPEGKPLLDRVKGDDEIKTLDSSFHEMATALS